MMKVEVYKSSNSEDWMWRVESVGKVAPMENEVVYPSKRAAVAAAERWVIAMLHPFFNVGIKVTITQNLRLDEEGNPVVVMTWDAEAAPPQKELDL